MRGFLLGICCCLRKSRRPFVLQGLRRVSRKICRRFQAKSIGRQKIRREIRREICQKLSTFCASFFPSFFPPPHRPSFLHPSPSLDLKTPPFPRGNVIFRGWDAARVLEGVTPQKKEGISLKNGAQKLVQKIRRKSAAKSAKKLPWKHVPFSSCDRQGVAAKIASLEARRRRRKQKSQELNTDVVLISISCSDSQGQTPCGNDCGFRSGLVRPFLSLFVFFWSFTIFLGLSQNVLGYLFPIGPFPLSRPIKSTYKEHSRKGPGHNREKMGNPSVWKLPGLPSQNLSIKLYIAFSCGVFDG